MEKTNLRAETDRLWVQVETLQWGFGSNTYVKAASVIHHFYISIV
jgi:hypothetical protein